MGVSALTVSTVPSVHVQMSGYKQVDCEQYLSVEFGTFQFLGNLL